MSDLYERLLAEARVYGSPTCETVRAIARALDVPIEGDQQ